MTLSVHIFKSTQKYHIKNRQISLKTFTNKLQHNNNSEFLNISRDDC